MNVYDAVTERILSTLERGVIPWRRNWVLGLPKSLGSGKEYRGINIILLYCSGYSSRYWTTYKEALRLGGHVKRGEKATQIVYWHWRSEEELARLKASGKTAHPAPCVPFVSFVFNLDQTEGIERPSDDVKPTPSSELGECERVLVRMQDAPALMHSPDVTPCYRPSPDRIELPFASQFEERSAYFLTLFHELIHATGHPKRLARFELGSKPSREAYSYEELVAEFGAAFLGARTGTGSTVAEELQASYIAGWSKVFREDKGILLRAAAAAQRACDFIDGRVEPDTRERSLPAETVSVST